MSPEEAPLWREFQEWCGSRFESYMDFVRKVKMASQGESSSVTGARRDSTSSRGRLRTSMWAGPNDMVLLEQEFINGLPKLGWIEGEEEYLFEALDIRDGGSIIGKEQHWLSAAILRYQAKERCRRRMIEKVDDMARTKRASQTMHRDFKAYLKKQFGCIYHAWRRALDENGSMTLQRSEMFKFSRQHNWGGDVRLLWKALDADCSGCANIEELDPSCAQVLARFKVWADTNYGPKPSIALWTAIDHADKGKISHGQFIRHLQAFGFDGDAKLLAYWLDYQCKKYIVAEDLSFIERWSPPAWLTAEPNRDAADELLHQLTRKYGHLLRAWRQLIDQDNSNCCSWHELAHAAKSVHFRGNIAEAWLALDEDLSGYITFAELDPRAYEVLMDFKMWCIREFGGVCNAFKALDSDESGTLSFNEFRSVVRLHGYLGDLKMLFSTLDQGFDKTLQLKEMNFLDYWEVPSDELQDGLEEVAVGSTASNLRSGDEGALEEQALSPLLEYRTLNPGPGHYDVLPGFGALPWVPHAKHSGAFTFSGRGPHGSQCWHEGSKTLGPAAYDSSTVQRRRKPSYSFGRQCRTPRREPASPGPGAYEARSTFQGPQVTMSPRRTLLLHPAERVYALGASRACSSMSHR